jgi:hypothetical protein
MYIITVVFAIDLRRRRRRRKNYKMLTDFLTHFRITRSVQKTIRNIYHTNHGNGLENVLKRSKTSAMATTNDHVYFLFCFSWLCFSFIAFKHTDKLFIPSSLMVFFFIILFIVIATCVRWGMCARLCVSPSIHYVCG